MIETFLVDLNGQDSYTVWINPNNVTHVVDIDGVKVVHLITGVTLRCSQYEVC